MRQEFSLGRNLGGRDTRLQTRYEVIVGLARTWTW